MAISKHTTNVLVNSSTSASSSMFQQFCLHSTSINIKKDSGFWQTVFTGLVG